MQHPDTPIVPTPRIYVASLSDYNAGRLHGRWIDVDLDDDVLHEAVSEMLAESTEDVAEEWAIHDFENFGPLHLGEYDSLGRVAEIGRGIARHGIAFAHYAAMLGPSAWDELDRFEDYYQGHWESMTEYAWDLLDSLGMDPDRCTGLPDMLRPYVHVDVEAFAQYLATEVSVSQADDGVYVFES